MKLLCLIFLVLMVACEKDKAENVLRIPLPSEIPTIDPAVCYDQACQQVVLNGYEPLYEYEYLKRPYQLRPLLAKDMPVIEGSGKKITIHIKRGIPYHPHPFLPTKREVLAKDFVIALKRQAFQGGRAQGWWLFEKRIVGLDQWRSKVGTDFAAFFTEPLKGVETPDDYTLIIHLTKPFPQLQYALAMNFMAPIPEEAVRALKNDLGEHMVGTGPFRLVNFQTNQQAEFVRFDGYKSSRYPTVGDRQANEAGMLADAGKTLPLVDRLVFPVMKEQQTVWLNFLSGKAEIMQLTKDYYAAALGADGGLSSELRAKKINMVVAPTLIYWWLSFNMRDPVVGKNLKLRQAIAHAVDVDKFIKLFTNNAGQKANSIYPPGVPGYDPSATLPYTYDLAKAKALLAQAGHPGGKGLPELVFDARGNSTLNRQIAEFISNELMQIGVRAKINVNTFPVFLERSRRGELQFWHDGWVMDYPDAENILQLLASTGFAPGPNKTFYANKRVDAAFERARYLPDGEEKFEQMAIAEHEVHKDLPWIMLYYSRNTLLTLPRVRNFRYSDIISNYPKYIRLTPQ